MLKLMLLQSRLRKARGLVELFTGRPSLRLTGVKRSGNHIRKEYRHGGVSSYVLSSRSRMRLTHSRPIQTSHVTRGISLSLGHGIVRQLRSTLTSAAAVPSNLKLSNPHLPSGVAPSLVVKILLD